MVGFGIGFERAAVAAFVLLLGVSVDTAVPAATEAADHTSLHSAPPGESPDEEAATVDAFNRLRRQLEDLVQPSKISGMERHALRRDLDFLVRILEATDRRGERAPILARVYALRAAEIRKSRIGVIDGGAEHYAGQMRALDAEEEQLREEFRRLGEADRDLPDLIVHDAVPLAAPGAEGPEEPNAPRGIIEQMEALVVPPGRLDAETKQVLRRRLDPLIVILEAPISTEEQVTMLESQLQTQIAALERFRRDKPVDGTTDLYSAYLSAIAGEVQRLRGEIERLKTSGD